MYRMFSIVGKIRLWGVKGVMEYLCRIGKIRRGAKWFISNARMPGNNKAFGITLVGPMRTTSSLSKVLRDFAFMLRESGIPYQTFDTCKYSEVPEEDVSGLLTPKADFLINKYSHIVEMFIDPRLNAAKIKTHKIVFWEFDSGYPEARPEMMASDSIVVMSDFNHAYLQKVYAGSAKVRKILYPFRFNVKVSQSQACAAREAYGIPQKSFMVFFNFDIRSSCGRKNPESLIHAFATAFHNVPDAVLVLKTMGAKTNPDKVAGLTRMVGELDISDRVVFIHEYVSQEKLYALTKACDVYCSLHRGEGFGLGIAEAMSMEKAVVISDWSAPTEFCKSDNSIPIPVKIVPVAPSERDHNLYRWVKTWAEPDVKAAALALRKLYDDPTYRKDIGAKAKSSIENYFSIENFRKSICHFIENTRVD